MVDLVLIDEVKRHLNKTDPKDDAELAGFIASATEIVEDYVGPVLARTFVERHPSGLKLSLFQTPVLTVTSVDAWLDGGTAHAVADLVVDEQNGHVYRRDGLTFTGGPFLVEYEAGRAEVPPNVQLAALIIIAHMWETQRGRTKKMPGAGGTDSVVVPTGLSYSVPRRALEALRPHMRPLVVA